MLVYYFQFLYVIILLKLYSCFTLDSDKLNMLISSLVLSLSEPRGYTVTRNNINNSYNWTYVCSHSIMHLKT